MASDSSGTSYDTAQLPEGLMIGGFKVMSLIGQGAMGVVYRARQVSLERDVALKILNHYLAGDRNYIERFLREAKIAARLRHPNIVQAIDVGDAAGFYYFAMELVDGESVAQVLKRRERMTISHATEIASQIADALEYAWRKAGMIHRDVKPDNILIDADGTARLSDMGMAHYADAEMTMTVAGQIIGTPQYLSPEQAEGDRNVDHRTDIYSLGCTLYHMITGAPPYDSGTVAGVLGGHLTKPAPDPRTVVTAMPGELAEFVMKMMSKKREDRPQTAHEVAVFLKRFSDAWSARKEVTSSFDLPTIGEKALSEHDLPDFDQPSSAVIRVLDDSGAPRIGTKADSPFSHAMSDAELRSSAVVSTTAEIDEAETQTADDMSVPEVDDPGSDTLVERVRLTPTPDEGARAHISSSGLIPIGAEEPAGARRAGGASRSTLHRSRVSLRPAEPGTIPQFEPTGGQKKCAALLGAPITRSVAIGRALALELVLIPPGIFMMGSSADQPHHRPDEGPVHKVRITQPFYMGIYQVTRGQFARFVEETHYVTSAEKRRKALAFLNGRWSVQRGVSWRAPLFPQDDNHPVVCVSWDDAMEFCKWLSIRTGHQLRLVTEAEWEHACRAGSKATFWWGDKEVDAEHCANAGDISLLREVFKKTDEEIEALYDNISFFPGDDGYAYTAPVGSFHPNHYGLRDMLGNAWEWCADYYDAFYYNKSTIDNPNGPHSGSYRVLRGGAWDDVPAVVRSAVRNWNRPDHADTSYGFRIAASIGRRKSTSHSSSAGSHAPVKKTK